MGVAGTRGPNLPAPEQAPRVRALFCSHSGYFELWALSQGGVDQNGCNVEVGQVKNGPLDSGSDRRVQKTDSSW